MSFLFTTVSPTPSTVLGTCLLSKKERQKEGGRERGEAERKCTRRCLENHVVEKPTHPYQVCRRGFKIMPEEYVFLTKYIYFLTP